jgi:iron complex outermembrane receptor protein
MSIRGHTRLLTVLAGFAACSATSARAVESQTRFPSQLDEVLVTARQTPESLEEVPVAVTTLSAERIARYEVSSLEKLAATQPDLILTRGNSGSGLDISLRGIGPNFSSIGIEQSVAVVVDGVFTARAASSTRVLSTCRASRSSKARRRCFSARTAPRA